MSFEHKHTSKRMHKVKSGHRTDISASDWGVGNYVDSDICERLMKIDESQPGFCPVDIIDGNRLSPEKFAEFFLNPRKPVIVRGLLYDWPAISQSRWSFSELEKRFKHILFKVGEDDNGRRLKVKMKTFMDYMRHQRDDSPLYLFESGMEGSTSSIRDDYSIPSIFPDDFLNLAGCENKPPHKWFCIGPKRSGTTVHRDPMGTAAWNAVTCGIKRWVMFEPNEQKSVVRGRKFRLKNEDDEAIHYFDFLLPRIRTHGVVKKIYECIQYPGDLIFVPGQWWHGVLNLTDTVAVTQNYCGWDNIDDVFYRVCKQRKLFASRWVKNAKKYSPPLYAKMMQLTHKRGNTVECTSSASSSSDSSDSSDYSSSETYSDIEHIGFPQ